MAQSGCAELPPAGASPAAAIGMVAVAAPSRPRHEDYCRCENCPGEATCCCEAPAPLRPLAALICSSRNGHTTVASVLGADSDFPIAHAPAVLPFPPSPRIHHRCGNEAPHLRDLRRPDPPPRLS